MVIVQCVVPSRRNRTSFESFSTRSWWLTADWLSCTAFARSCTHSSLSWSAYRILMREESPNTRNRSASSYSTSSSGITTGSVFSCPAGVICSNPIMSVLLLPHFV